MRRRPKGAFWPVVFSHSAFTRGSTCSRVNGSRNTQWFLGTEVPDVRLRVQDWRAGRLRTGVLFMALDMKRPGGR